MKIIMPGLAGPDWDGHIVGWAPGHVTEIPDDNEKAVAWARGWLQAGAMLVEDTPAPEPVKEPVKAEEPPTPEEPVAAPEPTLADLRAQAEARGLATYGSKAQLQERLASYQAGQGE